MQRDCFSKDVEIYLCDYRKILEEMIRGMTEAELTDSISHNFIVQMIPHHCAAIEMSNNVLSYTCNATLRRIASNIVEEQTKSIENMCEIAECCGEFNNSPRELFFYQQKMNRIIQMMFCRMEHAKTENRIDCDFMWEMIPHHEGAVRMSRNTLQFSICPQLKPILETIITSQERGIREMQSLLWQICR